MLKAHFISYSWCPKIAHSDLLDLLSKLKYITEVHRPNTWRLAELEMLNGLYCRGVSVNVCVSVNPVMDWPSVHSCISR